MTEKGIEYETVRYIDQPLSLSELKELLRLAGLRAEEVIRTKEPAYKQFVADKHLSDDELLKVIAAHPELLQRPIVRRGRNAVLARPVENLGKLGIR